MWLSVGLSLAVCVLWLFSYHHIFNMTFDEAYARASGASPTLFNSLAAVVVAVVIVISMRLVGTLLVSSLLVVPAVAGITVCGRIKIVEVREGKRSLSIPQIQDAEIIVGL